MLMRDTDITTEFPADVDDENISAQGISPSLPGELTKVSSALALFRASRILSKTLDHLYPAKASYQLSLHKLHALSDELDQWSEEMPEHLRLRFANDKPATNVISCRSPILSLTYFFVRGLIHRPILCHGSGGACSAATIVLATAGKHTLQILDLLDERRMNYTFPFNRKELLISAGFSILWQSIDLEQDSKLVKDNQKSLSLMIGLLARVNQPTAADFQGIATSFVRLDSRRLVSPNHIPIDTSAAKLLKSMPAPQVQASTKSLKSTRKQLQAIASRFSTFSNKPSRPEEPRRATVPQTNAQQHLQSLSPQQRAGSTVSLSSTRSAPVYPMSTPSPTAFNANAQKGSNPNRTPSINLDYFPFADDLHELNPPTSSSTMLPPRKPGLPNQMSPNIANGSWDNLLALNGHINPASMSFDALTSTFLYPTTSGASGTPNLSAATPMSLSSNNGLTSTANAGTDWIDSTGWSLPTMDFKAPVPQSLLSFSGESMTDSADEVVFSASSVSGSGVSNNGSQASGNGNGHRADGTERQSLKVRESEGEAYRGITIPIDDMDDGFEFADLDR
jgi:hypothetical protein